MCSGRDNGKGCRINYEQFFYFFIIRSSNNPHLEFRFKLYYPGSRGPAPAPAPIVACHAIQVARSKMTDRRSF